VLDACAALGCPPSRAHRVAAALLEAAGAGGMVGGQWADLLGEGRSLSAAELDDLHRRKTGALLAASLVMGAVAADADAPVVRSMEEYGKAIGLAFQIADDVLDATQPAHTLGKNPSDAALGKSTYVSLHGLDAARAMARAEVDRAVRALSQAGVESPALVALAAYVVERES
jgi:geranylgeranyl pyrophosphate synthase